MGTAEALLDGGTFLAFAVLASKGLTGWPHRPARRLRRTTRTRRLNVPPLGRRPFEVLVTRGRVLGPRVRRVEPGMRFAKYDGIRQGYDAVLGELADELGIVHLLAVIPPGPALDRERVRVENAVERAGVDLGLPLV